MTKGAIHVHGKVGVRDGIWKKIYAKVKNLDKKYAKVGILSDKGGNETTEDGEFTMIELGAIHQFGSEKAGIPARYWLTKPFEEKKDEVSDKCAEIVKLVIMDKVTVRRGLEMLGMWASTEVKKYITSGPHLEPPLSARTVARKGSSRPLVDTGRLVGSITYEVVE